MILGQVTDPLYLSEKSSLVLTARTLNLANGTAISVTGGTQDLSADRTWTINHADTSSVGNIGPLTGANVLSAMTFDTMGHVQTFATRALTAVDVGAIQNQSAAAQNPGALWIQSEVQSSTAIRVRRTGVATRAGGIEILNSAATQGAALQLNADTIPGLTFWIHNGTTFVRGMELAANRRVAIGDNPGVPQFPLHVFSANPSGVAIQNTSALGAGSGGFFQAWNSGTPNAAGQVLGGLTIGANTTGTSFPQGAIIQALSESTWTAGSSHPTVLSFYTTPAFAVNPAERLRITSAGNVGIGTGASSLLARLVIKGGSETSDPNGIFATGQATALFNVADLTNYAIGMGKLSGGNILLGAGDPTTGYSRHLVINAGTVDGVGNPACTGIGVANPDYRLTVSQDISIRGANLARILSQGDIKFCTNNVAEPNTTKLLMTADGGLVVGGSALSASYKLEVVGLAKLSNTNTHFNMGELSSAATFIQAVNPAANAGRDIAFFSTTENMRILANGNTGIATSTPTEKLTVQGNALISEATATGAIRGRIRPQFGLLNIEAETYNGTSWIAGTGTIAFNSANISLSGNVTASGPFSAANVVATQNISMGIDPVAKTTGFTAGNFTTYSVDNAVSSITILLPAAATGNNGRIYMFRITNGSGTSGQPVTIGGMTVDLGPNNRGPLVIVQSNGTQWVPLQGIV